MIHFRDAKEVLQILRDVQTYMFIQSKNDELGAMILLRIERILTDNDNTKLQGEANENNKRNRES